jgi:hypothetical protein
MSGPLVVATLADRKTVTRRLLATQPPAGWEISGDPCTSAIRMDTPGPVLRCPFGVPGDRLYVRETWRPDERTHKGVPGVDGIAFPDGAFHPIENTAEAADLWGAAWANGKHGDNWRPSIHMPKWASRLTLEVTVVRVERVQDITEEGVRAEGLPLNTVFPEDWSPSDGWLTPAGLANAERGEDCDEDGMTSWRGCRVAAWTTDAREAFEAWWDSLAPAGSKWADSPWVWAVSFRRCAS